MGALFFEGMNYGVNCACRLRPKPIMMWAEHSSTLTDHVFPR